MKYIRFVFLAIILIMFLNGCLLTKLITVPMRLTGAVISIVPAVGNTAHDTIDEVAEKVDDIPI